MKNILVLAHDDKGQEARLQVALDVTRAIEGHLTCLDVAMNPLVGDEFAASYVGAQLALEEKRNETANRARVEARVAAEGIPYSWIDLDGDAASCIRRSAALADLIVVNRRLDGEASYPNMFDLAGDVILEGRLPVLTVPQQARSLDLGGNAIVAWDGSNHAVAAMRAAIPLLKLAQSVTLFHAEDGSLKVPLEEAAAYLSRHGISPVIRREQCLMDRPGALILAETMIAHASYAVMGAFSRSRFLEAAFGGATQRMLTESPVPVLFVHAA